MYPARLIIFSFLLLALSACSTSLGAQLGLHKSMNDEMVFDAIKSHHDQLIIDRYSLRGEEAATVMRWVGLKNDPHRGGFLDELRKEMVIRNPNWPKNVKEAILQGNIVRGMDAKQVRASWGTPSSTSEGEMMSDMKHGSWQYIAKVTATTGETLFGGNKRSFQRGGIKYYGMVLFRNGKVSSFQTFD